MTKSSMFSENINVAFKHVLSPFPARAKFTPFNYYHLSSKNCLFAVELYLIAQNVWTYRPQ